MTSLNMKTLKTLLIGVWGLPAGWSHVDYIPIIPPEEEKDLAKPRKWRNLDKPVRSHSTILAEASALLEKGFSVEVIIYVMDTLASPGGVDKTGCSTAGTTFNKIKNLAIEEPPCDYGEVKSRAYEIAVAYLECFLHETLGSRNVLLDLEVLPGSGVYSVQRKNGGSERVVYEYSSSPLTTLSHLRYNLTRHLTGSKPDLVVLDTSHGINFLPTLAVEALKDSIETYTALRRESIHYAIINSDPVLEKGSRSRIHIIKAGTYARKPLEVITKTIERLKAQGEVKPYKIMLNDTATGKPPEQALKLNEIFKKALEDYRPLATSLSLVYNYGLPLYLATKASTINLEDLKNTRDRLEQRLADALGLEDGYKPDIKLENKDNSVRVRISWRYIVTPEAVDLLDTLILLEKTLQEIRPSTHGNNWFTEKAETYFSLDYLEKLVESLGLSKAGAILFKKEKSDIKRRVQGYLKNNPRKPSKPRTYNEILEATYNCKQEETPTRKTQECNPDKRNFYAHAGLERNTIKLTVRHKKIYIAYKAECIKPIDNIINTTQ